MEKKWIKESGICRIEEVEGILNKFLSDGRYLMGCTDSYNTGYWSVSAFADIELASMLELRVFNSDREVLFFRSMLDEKIQWRVTDDTELEELDFFDSEQFIDINEEKSVYFADEKMMSLFTTVGGKYMLPIDQGQNAVRIRKYISYDKNGMAHVEDQRVVSFMKK